MPSADTAAHSKHLRLIILGVAIVAVAAAVLLYRHFASTPAPPVYSGTIETREIEVGSKIGGRVTAVSVEEGQTVAAGAPLIQFEADELRAQLAQAQAEVASAQADFQRLQTGNRPEEIAQADEAAHERAAELDAARNGPRPEELRQAQADYAAAQADARDAASTYTRMQPLAAKDVISRQQFDTFAAQRDATAQRAESLRQRLSLLQAGTRSEDLRAAADRYRQAAAAAALAHRGFRSQDIDAGKARLAQAQGHVQELDARLREASLAAPAASTVETVSVRPGDLVPAGQIVVTLLEPSQLWVKVYVPETDLSRVRLGQPADVTVDLLPARTFSGRVQEVASAAEFLPRNVQAVSDREHQVFGVKIQVDNDSGILKSGMSATVHLR